MFFQVRQIKGNGVVALAVCLGVLFPCPRRTPKNVRRTFTMSKLAHKTLLVIFESGISYRQLQGAPVAD
jgi:hypothetical protein